MNLFNNISLIVDAFRKHLIDTNDITWVVLIISQWYYSYLFMMSFYIGTVDCKVATVSFLSGLLWNVQFSIDIIVCPW